MPARDSATGKQLQLRSLLLSLLPLLLLLLTCPPPVRSEDQPDLYSVLGVSRSATPQEVKQAYKRLARANHPDKSKEPGASERFVRINEAYEVLSDPAKRREYDMFGTVQADPRHPNFHSFHASPFAEFFQHQQQHQQRESEASGPALEQITLRQYQVRVAPDSWRRPALLFGLADLCFPCMRVSPLWRRLAEDLLPLGVPMSVVHAGMSSNLAELLRIDQVPAIIGVVDGVAYHFSGQLSLTGLRDFYRSLFPVDTLAPFADAGAAAFLAGWPDNRPRAVLAKPLRRPPIRFLLAAYALRSRIAFAYADTSANEAASFLSKRRVSGATETALLFDEDGEVGRLEAARLETDALIAWLEARRHLALPRLASPELAEELCPAQINYRDKFLCAVLLLRPGEETGLPAAVFRREARRWERRRRDGLADSRVRLVHAHADSQLDFLRSLGSAEEPAGSFAGRVLLLWRATASRLGYRWLSGRWNVSLTVEQLREALAAVAEDSLGLTVQQAAPPLADENRPALPIRIWRRLLTLWGRAVIHLRRTDPSGPLLIGLTVAMVIGTAFVMTRLAQWEEQKLRSGRSSSRSSNGASHKQQQQQQRRSAGPSPCETAGRRPDNSRMLVELEPGNYRRLISASPQGQIALVLVTDADLKAKLAADFARCLAPFASVERLRFAVLDVGDRLGWYRTILEFVIGRKLGDRVIRPRNCSGTVLAVNGFRKYFCIYHPKIRSAMQRQFDCRFLGLHDSDESSEDSSDDCDGEAGATLTRRRRWKADKGAPDAGDCDPLSHPDAPLFERDLLAGLPNWLDRLFDGQLPRVRVDAWPESLTD